MLIVNPVAGGFTPTYVSCTMMSFVSRSMSCYVTVTYSGLFGLKLFLPLQPILFDLSLSFFLRLLQTSVLTCEGRETPTTHQDTQRVCG